MTALKELYRLSFGEDIYMLRAGGRRVELCFTLGNGAVRLLDVAARSHRDLPFPQPEFLIHSWLITPDGTRSFLFSSDPLDYALALDHKQLAATKIRLPADFPTVTNLCWMSPDVHILDRKGGVWSIHGDEMIRVRPGDSDESLASFYRTLTGRYAIRRIDTEANGLCVIDQDRQVFGLVSLRSGEVTMAPWSADMFDVAHRRGHLFACTEEEVAHFHNGHHEQVLTAPPGRQFWGLEAGSLGADGYLAVGSFDLSGKKRPYSYIDIYKINE